MNCAEVQNRLLEYLDRSLDAISSKHLEIHLSSCPPCRAEVDGLADCVRQVATLPVVDPPIGFAQRVMAHAREIERKPAFWRRLSLSPRSLKPIQATAVVLIALLGFQLYRQENPQIPEIVQTEPASSQVASLTERSETTPHRAQSEPIADLTGSVRPQAESASAAATPPPAVEIENRAVPAATERSARESASETGWGTLRRAPIPVQEIATGRSGSRSAWDSFGPGDFLFGPGGDSLRRSAPVPGRPFFSMNEPSADMEFIVRRRMSHRSEPAEEEGTEAQPSGSEGPVRPQSVAGPVVPFLSATIIETRWYTVAPEHLEHFKKDLAAETHVESEWTGAGTNRESSTRPLAIKVIILPPAPGDR